VVYLAMRLMTLGCRVIAHAPQPPLDFYREFESIDEHERIRQVKKYSGYLEGAKNADIFLIGVGTGRDDMRYRRVLGELGIELANAGAIAGEIGYQPFNSTGAFVEFPKLIAVTGEELAALSRTTTKVVAVVGGEPKIPAIQALLKRDHLPFNVLITDEAIAGIFDREAEAR
jgi:DNA-binding transcriptional regulator LsrR (DeoR family)